MAKFKEKDRIACSPDEDDYWTYGMIFRKGRDDEHTSNFYECLLISQEGCEFYEFVIEKFMRQPDIIEELLYF